MTTIILSHPWSGSFNNEIFNKVKQNLEAKKEEHIVIDLIKDNFNPVLTQCELSFYSKGEFLDPLVGRYQSVLRQTDNLILIFPIWWADMPAILKGFFDKVMLKDFAYTNGKLGIVGKLTNINKTTIITTSNSSKWYIRLFAGNTIQGTLIESTLKLLGIKNASWIHCGDTHPDKQKERDKFLDSIGSLQLIGIKK